MVLQLTGPIPGEKAQGKSLKSYVMGGFFISTLLSFVLSIFRIAKQFYLVSKTYIKSLHQSAIYMEGKTRTWNLLDHRLSNFR